MADLDARVARALSRDRPVIINGTPYTDPARMKAVIHGSDMMVAVAADDSTGVHIIFLGPEDPDGPGD
ncbi:hypothetical protein HON52_00350 [Candidatus Uhrbacteria bacterium]|nr:hypothetical protein [Candidatus Uhrbacteria bacterium]